MRNSPYESYWPALWQRLLDDQSRLYDIQQSAYSDWRARKLLALRDSEGVFYSVDEARAERRLSFGDAWHLFTDEMIELYLAAARRADEAYAAGLETALACQRGHHPDIDAPPINKLILGRS